MITIDLSGAETASLVFAKLVPRVQSNVLSRLAKAVHDDVEQSIDKHTKTGAMLQSLRWSKYDDHHVIFNDLQRAPHARFVHWGSRPHIIKPRNKKVLRWVSGNGFVFSKFVNHPGYKGDPYFVHAADNAPRHFARIIEQLQSEGI